MSSIPENFKIVSRFNGYSNKQDITNLGDGFLVSGSQNVISTDGNTIAVRKGFTLDGASNSALTPIKRSFEWKTVRGLEIPLRSYDTKLEFRYSGAWYELASGFSSILFEFDSVWKDVEKSDLLLFVNGDSNLREWSGGVTTFASAAATTITKQGTTSWKQEGFNSTGSKSITINGTTYTYMAGEDTTTLTGVTPNPTLAGHAVGSVIAQTIVTTANKPVSGFSNDLIAVLRNQVYIASYKSRLVYVSKNTDYLDYTFSSPRLPGDGALITLDGTPTGFAPQEENMYISAGTDQWYVTNFELSADITKEFLKIIRLKTDSQGAAIKQSAIGLMKNKIVFISNEPTLDFLGRVENVSTPQGVPLSDPIKNDFQTYNFTDAHVKYFKNNLYIALPRESRLLIYNIQKNYWEPPQILPTGRLAIINGNLYLHSNVVPETYKLFDSTSDNGNPIAAIAKFSYMNYGARANKKVFNEWYTEGYISTNTTLTRKIYYDYKGFTTINSEDILGNSSIITLTSTTGSLGKKSLGKAKFGGSGGDDFPKFRVVHGVTDQDFWEMQPEYSSNGVDQRWELIAFGGNVDYSEADNNEIKI